MTIILAEKTLQQPRAKLWQIASHFEAAVQWVDGLEKVEQLSGAAARVGGVWRVQTQVSVQCEYAPSTRLAKIKNLIFLRRNYFHRLEASLEALERLAREQAA